jgi:hypothetical protein
MLRGRPTTPDLMWEDQEAACQAPSNVVYSVFQKELLGPRSARGLGAFSRAFSTQKLDSSLEGVPELVSRLAAALKRECFVTIARCVSACVRKLVDSFGTPLQPTANQQEHGHGHAGHHHEHRIKRLDREAFVLLGGVELLIQVFRPPLAPLDARDMSANEVANIADMWNEALVTLRELSFTEPTLGTRLATQELLTFLFTLMAHQPLFDNAVGLIEEVLAVHSSTFSMDVVPGLRELLVGLNSRQLAHFCRVFALLVFEPEDRQMMESNRVIPSMELLHVRRKRVAMAGSIVDRNQAILMDTPELLQRLVSLLRIMNHAPPLSSLVNSHAMNSFPSAIDILMMQRGTRDVDDWEYLESLREVVSQGGPEPPPAADSAHNAAQGNGSGSVGTRLGGFLRMFRRGSADVDGADGASGTTPSTTPGADGSSSAHILEELLGPLASTPLDMLPLEMSHVVQLMNAASVMQNMSLPQDAPNQGSTRRRTRDEARSEIQFNALLLTTHQVEVLFVLSTLLGGRRKLDVQERLARLNLVDVLTEMFPRLAWGAPPAEGPNPMQRIHGPDCECNPESALRVQYLRLIHNFCDRDSVNNPYKSLLLSSEERAQLLRPGGSRRAPDEVHPRQGLLSMIIDVHLSEPQDSIYRFWLASCIEAYLRGSSREEQMMIAQSGLLQHLAAELTSDVPERPNGALQTSFDVLGELSKGNLDVLCLFSDCLAEDGMAKLGQVLMSNLVDSNVFLRSLVISTESLATSGGVQDTREMRHPPDASCYLSCAWWDVQTIAPTIHPESDPMALVEEGDASSSNSLKEKRGLWGTGLDLGFGLGKGLRDLLPMGAAGAVGEESAEVPIRTPDDDLPLPAFRQFLQSESSRLIRDLMRVVDFRSINHENICCLNTVILMMIHRCRQSGIEGLTLELDAIRGAEDGEATLANFRRLLWFWSEYYEKRGRDRLSLEFSSHVPFLEWRNLVHILSSDDGRPGSLLHAPIRLPVSPYSRSIFMRH